LLSASLRLSSRISHFLYSFVAEGGKNMKKVEESNATGA
jgi:hypothetical protein